jgi:2'-5' RNA ligase
VARLFLAIETPPDAASQLLATLPGPHGLRPVPVSQVHLTLRFLGDCDAVLTARVLACLRGLTAAAPVIAVQGAGHHRGRQGEVLWAGVRADAALSALHAAITDALLPAGFAPEARAFRPHLTLARCRPGTPGEPIAAWLAAGRTLALPPWVAPRFALFDSQLAPGGALHRLLEGFPLNARAGDG